MFRESVNHARTEAIIDLIRTLPEKEQAVIARQLTVKLPKKPLPARKKLSRKEKNRQVILNGIAEGLREIKEAKRTGKPLMDLEDALNEL